MALDAGQRVSAEVRGALDAVWRVEGPRTVAAVARMVGDVGLAEDLVQEAVAEALVSWPRDGRPQNPGAWLTAVAKRRAIDLWRRRDRLDERYRELARDLEDAHETEWVPIADDMLSLVFTACHPVLPRDARVALTLRVVGGLSAEEIARLFFVPTTTMQQRIVRAKKTLAAAAVPFEVPEGAELRERLAGVLAVVSLIFTEGYAATAGNRWVREDLAGEAIRLGRALAHLMPTEPEPLALLALMELQASRFAARTAPDGTPILLTEQDRGRWDHSAISRGSLLLRRSDQLAKRRGVSRGRYALQAAIAQCHAIAVSVAATDWHLIVVLYESLERLAPGPVVTLNRAVAVAMAVGPEAGLSITDELQRAGLLARSHLLPSVRAELLLRLGREAEAAAELQRAIALTSNTREREVLRAKLERLPEAGKA